MTLEELAKDYLAALDDEAKHEATRQAAEAAASAAQTSANQLKADMIALAKSQTHRFVLKDRLLVVDSTDVTVQAVQDLDLVR